MATHGGRANHKPITVLDQADPGYQDALLRSLETGALVLLENFDDGMDDVTEQLLARRVYRDSRGFTYIRLGDASVPYHPE